MTAINDEELLYSVDELQFRQQIQAFVETNITPIADKITNQTINYRLLFKKFGESGLTNLIIPKELGGAEKPFIYQLIAAEELSAVSPAATMMLGTSSTLSAIPIMKFGSDFQKQKYLVPIAEGEKIGALAVTEPNVGSDTAGMETTAIWKEETQCWILNGEKRYITNGSIADHIVTFAITNPQVDSKSGMSTFIVETNVEGFSILHDFELMGRQGAYNSHIKFENVNIPKENLLGKPNEGFFILMDEFDPERVLIAAEALGCMRKPFEIAVEYSINRIQFGRQISRFEGISFKIADMATKMRIARLLIITAARMIEQGIPCTKEAAMAKLFATEASIEICDLAIQIAGGAGYVKDYYPLEQFYRDARMGTIAGGTAEIMRFLIQREVYIEHKQEKAREPTVSNVADLDFDTLMLAIPNGFRPDHAKDVTAEIQFIFTNEKPWLLIIKDQHCSIEKTKINNPSMTLKTDGNTWREILLGKLDAMQATMSNKLIVDTEDMDLLMKFVQMFKLSPKLLYKNTPD